MPKRATIATKTVGTLSYPTTVKEIESVTGFKYRDNEKYMLREGVYFSNGVPGKPTTIWIQMRNLELKSPICIMRDETASEDDPGLHSSLFKGKIRNAWELRGILRGINCTI